MNHYINLQLKPLIFMTCLLLINTIQAQVCHVSTSGTSQATGANWQQTKDLDSALDNPATCPEIWVKSGTYYPTNSDSRSISFTVGRRVEVYGGFYGTETSRIQRDYLNNKAILSGDIGIPGIRTDNSYNVIHIAGSPGTIIDQDTIIDGFIIRDGYADGTLALNANGGGLNCESSGTNAQCSPVLRNLEFKDNQAKNGGAIYNHAEAGGESSPTLENVRFINNNILLNSTNGSGGAFYNSAFNATSMPTLNQVEFTNNSALSAGGAIANWAAFGTSNLVINGSTFSGNSAMSGGAFYSNSSSSGFSQTDISNSTFFNNTSQDLGGAIYITDGSINLNQVTISQNTAASSGGGIYTFDSNSNLQNSILWDNQANTGNQVFNNNSQLNVSFSVVENNCSAFGSAGSGSQTCNNILTGNPNLGTLQNNRGFTETLLPGVGSSAIDSGDNNNCTATDQRGIIRPQNGQCDIGSVEVLNTCRVTSGGSAVGNGSDWSGQAMDLPTALNTTSCHQVWIKTGTYKPTTSNNRDVSFTVLPGVVVMGGFAGIELNPNERNVAANPVVLSGDIGTINDMTDNSYHVIFLDGSQGTKIFPSTVIADLEIRDGYSSESFFDFPNNSGAGLFCDGSGINSACNPTLNNIRLVNNQSIGGNGGGLFNHAEDNGESSPQLINVTFDSNVAVNGGGLYNFGYDGGTSSPIAINNQFTNNTASNSGGAVYNNANVGISRSQFIFGSFINNRANYGGAIYCNGQGSGSNTASFNQVTFTSNQASFDGGALYSVGWDFGQSKPALQDVTFNSNLSQRGGAVFLNDLAGNGTAELNRVTFNQNIATDGGAMYNDGENGFSHPKVTNSTFHDNVAQGNGGAIYNNGDNGASSPEIINTTFSNNLAINGGAMYSSGDPSGVSSPVMRNIIMWHNAASTDGDTIYHNLAESNLFDSIIQFGCPTNGFGNANCNNIIDSDPMLGALTDNGGFTQTRLPGTGSSAIETGNDVHCPGEDQRGQTRPSGTACDIGAVEVYIPSPTDLIFKHGFE